MLHRTLLVVLCFAILSVGSIIYAQNETGCDRVALITLVNYYGSQIENASDEEFVAIAGKIERLISLHLERCSGETLQTELTPTPSQTPTATPPTATIHRSRVRLFSVIPTGNVNVRECGSTSCTILGTSVSGQVYDVFAVTESSDGDWYEIELDSGSRGYIASWLTTRGPDTMIDIYDGYWDTFLHCSVNSRVSRARSNNIDFAIWGEALNEVIVDILRPNRTEPEPVYRQYDKTFLDSEDLYIHQTYLSSYWPAGIYQLRLQRDGRTRVFGFNLEQAGETTIYVYCE